MVRMMLLLGLGALLGCSAEVVSKPPPAGHCGSYTTGPAACTWIPSWVEPFEGSAAGQCPTVQRLGCCSFDDSAGSIDKVTCSYAEDLSSGESAGPSKPEVEKECKAAKGTWGFVFPECN